jgi:tetratricopeptide (TPR) repeat protein
MSSQVVEDLRAELASGDVVVLVGAGVSIAATAKADVASWIGLLSDGVERAVAVNQGLPLQWATVARLELEMGRDGHTESLLSLAEKVTVALGGQEGGEYRRWLRETVGSLIVVDRSVPDALVRLGAPLATTNYDDVLATCSGWPAVTWRNPASVQQALAGGDRAVAHLHGHWRDSTSVVLGIRSYEAVLGADGAQALQRAVVAMRSLLRVGGGAGVGDPNLGGLLEWLVQVLPGAELRRYVVCLDGDVEDLVERYGGGQQLLPVPFGTRFEELAPFLAALAPEAAPFVAPAPAATGLPGLPRSIGRLDQVTALVGNVLADLPAPTVVLGTGGIGKTNLTLAAAHSSAVAARFGARRFFVRCEAATNAAAMWAQIGLALGLPASSSNLPVAIGTALSDAPALLILDNAETAWENDTLGTEELLAAVASFPGALVVSLRGLEQPGGPAWAPPISLQPLTAPDAKALFLTIAPARFDTAELDQLLAELGGVPLAVQLLAHAAEGEADLAALAARWRTERTALLQRAGAKDRLLSVAVSVEASWTSPTMTEPGRRLLSVLGALPDGIAHHDLDAIAPDAGPAAANVLRRRALAFDEKDRLRTYPPVRYYVAEAHRPDDADCRRLLEHYRALASELGPQVGGGGGAEAIARLAAEFANMTAVFTSALGADEADLGVVDATERLSMFQRFTGLGDTALLSAAVAHAIRFGDAWRQATCITGLGGIAQSRSDHDTARARYEEALPLYRQVDNIVGEANCVKSLGDIALARSDHQTARARYDEALPLYRQVNNLHGEANCIKSLGDIDLERYEYDAAGARYDEALPLYRQVGNLLGEANCIKCLGDIALARSDDGDARLDEAAARYDEALPLYRDVGNLLGEANCIQGLGDIALARSDYDTAAARYDESLPLYRQVNNVLGEANCIISLGDIAHARSDDETAGARYEESLALYERIPEPYSIGQTHRRLAQMAVRPDERERHVEAARQAWSDIQRDDLVAALDELFPSPS